MIRIEKVHVSGWDAAIRGMRNSFNSWGRSDSEFAQITGTQPENINVLNKLGWADRELMKRLSGNRGSHSKFRRYITVTFDITAPLYWWKEFDTYKVGTVANSCSTMHTIAAKPFERDDFSHEHLMVATDDSFPLDVLDLMITTLNECRSLYLETKEKKYWWQMIQLLPSSYNQKRTIILNYEVLSAMYGDRRYHKLDEWRKFCDWIETLPYANGIIFRERSDDEKIAELILMAGETNPANELEDRECRD